MKRGLLTGPTVPPTDAGQRIPCLGRLPLQIDVSGVEQPHVLRERIVRRCSRRCKPPARDGKTRNVQRCLDNQEKSIMKFHEVIFTRSDGNTQIRKPKMLLIFYDLMIWTTDCVLHLTSLISDAFIGMQIVRFRFATAIKF